ncbi:MAG: YvcK family protein [Acidimicrobiia bacterium]|nr:YvcK family protein [Acidimicrobiia bacterium]
MSSRAPKVVAIGGGHGLAVTLRAIRQYTTDITAIVSVADDGGSSGRLRRDLDIIAVGDLRKCLVALSTTPSTLWSEAFEYRFAAGDLDGHALGNLILAGLAAVTHDWEQAAAAAGTVLGIVGRVLPATSESVALRAEVEGGGIVDGQVAVQNSSVRIRRVTLVPPDAPSPPSVTTAIEQADQIVLAPGSLFTSLIPALCAPAVGAALARSRAPVVQIANLAALEPESRGLSARDHVGAVLDLGIRVDRLIVDSESALGADPTDFADIAVDLVTADVARPDVQVHEPAKLAPVLATLLESEVGPYGSLQASNGQRRPKTEGS